MPWKLTTSVTDFLTLAGTHLRAEPALNTVLLTVADTVRTSGPEAFGAHSAVFGWHESADGSVDGAFLHTSPFPVLLAALPAGSAAALISLLIAEGSAEAGANADHRDEAEIAAAWTAASGGTAVPTLRSRLYRLGGLMIPDPFPAGAARLAGSSDRDLLVEWHDAFGAEAGGPHGNASAEVAERLAHGGLMIFEADGEPVAMAAKSLGVAGVARVTTVYTPPQHRRRGYGGAATIAVTQAALDQGAREVVLFTNLANPTSNALYQRLGYQPVSDRVILELT